MQITTVGLDLAKRIFKFTPSTRLETLLCARHCADRKFCRSSSSYRAA